MGFSDFLPAGIFFWERNSRALPFHLPCFEGPARAPGPLPKSAPLHVLAAQPDVDALLQEGAKSHVLRQSPVHRPVLHQLPTGLQDPAQPCRDRVLTSRPAYPLGTRAELPSAPAFGSPDSPGEWGRELSGDQARAAVTSHPFLHCSAGRGPRRGRGEVRRGLPSSSHPGLERSRDLRWARTGLMLGHSWHWTRPNTSKGPGGALTSVNGEVLHRHGAGHVPNVRENILRQARGGAGHAPGLPVQGEEA